ncbi:DUF3108 domain-containing protein [Marinomonas transparens]|uniref:DUF3108 domain-containing protein n=1 Tax=Marinomonas transparens TaxID=2795388 RepID=A0A934JPU4_9GAMM|nr:DUF3108 domain-containing protein [Marinomonas transparens]MBJ7538453.1 DUF3108 domain-containing protein [Marinomonas transparens]
MVTHKVSMYLIATLMSLPILSFAASESDKDTFLTPYTAIYSTVWKKGISLKVEGKQTLSQKDDGLWQFRFTAEAMIASLEETSSFKVQNHQILPSVYQYKSSVLGKKKLATITFDWDKMRVRNDIKNKPWHLAIPPKTLDKLSIQLQVRQDLKLGKNEFNYQIADGGRLKNWRFERAGRDKIETSIGRLSAIKLIRTDKLESGKRTTFWFSPKHDYLLVKLEHKEDGESYRLDIDSVK